MPQEPKVGTRRKKAQTEEDSLYIATYVLGVVWFVIILTVVMEGTPEVPPTDARNLELLRSHQSSLYFLRGEAFVQSIFKISPVGWSEWGDRASFCVELKEGVWYATGMVHRENSSAIFEDRWQMIFRAGDDAPLYVRMGKLESGNFALAKKVAGLPESSPVTPRAGINR